MNSNPLWQHWEKTARLCGDKIVLIEASSGTTTTARELMGRARQFLDELPPCRAGERVAFRLSGSTGVALLLALQKAGLVAVPFDVGMPRNGCLELAKRLRVRTFYWDNQFHAVEAPYARDRTSNYLKLTSGSSAGEPKVIKCRAEHLVADGQQIIRSMGLRRNDRHLAIIPLGHSYGLGSLVMPLILQGATLIYAEQFVLRQVIEWINRYETTVFPGVPVFFRSLAALPGNEIVPSLRLAVSAGAPLQAEVAHLFLERYKVKVHNFYGSSETGGICYDRSGSASLSGRSVGKPLRGVRLSIRDGEIVAKSPAVATRGGRRKLSDIGEWNSRGELVLLGRAVASANIGGKKIHPVEVEMALRRLPLVSEAGVWVLNDRGRDFLAAAVESRLSQTEIEQQLAALLPAWKLPKRYVISSELPRTPRGKLDAAILRRRLELLNATSDNV